MRHIVGFLLTPVTSTVQVQSRSRGNRIYFPRRFLDLRHFRDLQRMFQQRFFGTRKLVFRLTNLTLHIKQKQSVSSNQQERISF